MITPESHHRQHHRALRVRTAIVACAGWLCLTVSSVPAPLSVNELEFMLRQGVSDAEIVREATSRRLLVPLDEAAVKSLKKNGARDSLVAKLKGPGIALDPAAAAAEERRKAANKARLDAVLAEDEARRLLRDRQWRQGADRLREAKTVQGWLHEKLYKLHRFNLQPVEEKSLDNVLVFGFFHGSMASAPSREFAPKLAEAYARLKEQYGNDFEVVFVSHDHDEYNQKEFMRTNRLTCPTMKLGSVDQSIMQFGSAQPWFVLVAENGKPASRNGVNKEFIEPFEVLMGLEQILAALRR